MVHLTQSQAFATFYDAVPTPEIYTLSLHDALPISHRPRAIRRGGLVLDRLQAHHGGDPHPTARDLRSTHHVRDRQKDDGEVPRRTVSERDDLVQALEAGGGFAAVGLATAATKAIPSLAGGRM